MEHTELAVIALLVDLLPVVLVIPLLKLKVDLFFGLVRIVVDIHRLGFGSLLRLLLLLSLLLGGLRGLLLRALLLGTGLRLLSRSVHLRSLFLGRIAKDALADVLVEEVARSLRQSAVRGLVVEVC